MNIDLIPAGDNVPHELNVFIEVPIGGEPVKYEFDKEAGAMFVDRILHTPMRYPANYGFVPQTLCDDGDPLDCLVMTRWALLPGTVIRARPVGVLHLEDEAGGDEKLLAVPVTKVSPYYKNVEDYSDLPPIVVEQIEHFFTHYKDLEKEKWVRVGKWGGREDALKIIEDSIARCKAR
ncbi:inorganic diphosphatase [Sphingomicrobium lutaoense]|uniref:Inorganic pyrophosphatase n=1 Tax=Sphingomicrobium lutaoense TaxID=515949 RepID=A0A839Z473_9SPHN|nr:inorganic diphosphatase [Sphingomicrobium lutaoense]MBB3764887.1 inorganic pyrophosphatase [Sphingomicrobium lutaoense]